MLLAFVPMLGLSFRPRTVSSMCSPLWRNPICDVDYVMHASSAVNASCECMQFRLWTVHSGDADLPREDSSVRLACYAYVVNHRGVSERTFSIWWFTPFTLDVTFRSAERVRLYLVLEFVRVSIVWRLSSNSSSVFDPCLFSDLALLASAYLPLLSSTLCLVMNLRSTASL